MYVQLIVRYIMHMGVVSHQIKKNRQRANSLQVCKDVPDDEGSVGKAKNLKAMCEFLHERKGFCVLFYAKIWPYNLFL